MYTALLVFAWLFLIVGFVLAFIAIWKGPDVLAVVAGIAMALASIAFASMGAFRTPRQTPAPPPPAESSLSHRCTCPCEPEARP